MAASLKAELRQIDYKNNLLDVGMSPNENAVIENARVLRGAIKYSPRGVLKIDVIRECLAILDQARVLQSQWWALGAWVRDGVGGECVGGLVGVLLGGCVGG